MNSRHASAIGELRRDVAARGGSVAIVSASPGVRRAVEPWGTVGDGLALMKATKARFDPHAILNPGRGPGGL